MDFSNIDWTSINWGLILKKLGELIATGAAFGLVMKPIIESIIDKKMSQYRDDAMRYMNDALRYRNEAREDKQEIEQIKEVVARDKEEITKKAQAINSQLSSAQSHETLLGFGESADAETSKDVNTQNLEKYLEPKN